MRNLENGPLRVRKRPFQAFSSPQAIGHHSALERLPYRNVGPIYHAPEDYPRSFYHTGVTDFGLDTSIRRVLVPPHVARL